MLLRKIINPTSSLQKTRKIVDAIEETYIYIYRVSNLTIRDIKKR